VFGQLLKVVFMAVLFLAPCFAQSDTSAPAPNPGSAATPPPNSTAAPKRKVWTNDDISAAKGGVSVVGGQEQSTSDAGKKTAKSSVSNALRSVQIKSYRNQIQQLQEQIGAIDKKIEQMKNFKGENSSPSGGIDPHGRYTMLPLEEQVKQLQVKKKELLVKIEDVETEARKNGIDPGELR
jgi:hypothetical protein